MEITSYFGESMYAITFEEIWWIKSQEVRIFPNLKFFLKNISLGTLFI